MKRNIYSGFYGFTYFWRTKQQQEIDYLEEIDGKISAFEFKWNPEKKARFSKTFTDNYDIEKTALINRNNYYTFLARIVSDLNLLIFVITSVSVKAKRETVIP